jgi:hypothetical protein
MKKVIKKKKRLEYTKEELERFKKIKVDQKEFESYYILDIKEKSKKI